MPAGTLYVVATPIGNLEDITGRARRVLAECGLVAAEDTRQTRKLLTHLGLSKTIISYYQPREEKQLEKIIAELTAGKSVALVSDGGTPCVSDPGYRLVKAALHAGIRVTPIPGPSALAAVLSASGLPTDRVTFAGFLPPKTSARRRALAELAGRRDTIVVFESPRRLLELLADIRVVMGDRNAAVWRELTKAFEEQVRGTVSELIAHFQENEPRGEITVVLQGAGAPEPVSEEELLALIDREITRDPRPLSAVAADLAQTTGWNRKQIYKIALAKKRG